MTSLTTNPSHVEIVPSNRIIGAEVRGVDVRHADERTMLTVRDALLRYSVVVLRDQELEPADQLAFMDRLYPLRPPEQLFTTFALEEHPAVVVVSNIVENGRQIGINDAGIWWHTDVCFFPDPDLFASLYALEVPQREGIPLGATNYVSTSAAYDALSEDDKVQLKDRKVVQSYVASLEKMERLGLLQRQHKVDEIRITTPDREQDVIRIHPISARKCIYVNESYSASIVDMDPDESQSTLARLFEHVSQDRFKFVHEWQVGDLLIWDNIATQHLATFDYGDIPRRLHRCSTAGPR